MREINNSFMGLRQSSAGNVGVIKKANVAIISAGYLAIHSGDDSQPFHVVDGGQLVGKLLGNEPYKTDWHLVLT